MAQISPVTVKKTIDKRQVRQHFSSHARDYDRYAHVQKTVAEKLCKRLLPLSGPWRHALEIGCGTGMLSQQVAGCFPDLPLVLSDLAHGMSQHTQQLQPRSPVCDADAAALPFVRASFDLVLSSSVYQWLNDLPNAFSEVARVLQRDGLLALAFFGERTLFELKESHQWALAEKLSHGQFFPNLEAVSCALQNKFEILQLESEIEVEWHTGVPALLRNLKKIGAQNASEQRPQGLASRQVMQKMINRYQQQYGAEQGIPATYEVIYLLARGL
ncbi:MAG: malonyl-[acyl-carrier protein] O-methyltransferase BioC [Desulfuromonadales bacterium C00003093]|nr:MAG: malonyl-[acyl-carrier protein] O-methyltransferase BioC [Desulfuromonadales bacterium C00003093]